MRGFFKEKNVLNESPGEGVNLDPFKLFDALFGM